VALAFLFKSLQSSRDRGEALSRQADQLKVVAGRLEVSLKNAATINARLNQSEARYKGLVDAQGDAIFRRDAASRLTYGNDAFFRLFNSPPRALSAIPSRRNRTRRAGRRCSAASWNRAVPARVMTSA